MTIQEAAAQKIQIVAHRGIAGGNIPCNSLPGFQAALRQGADVIELDVSRSTDGVLYVFHPGMEPVFLRSEKLISEMDSHEVDALRLVNQDSAPTVWGVPRLEEMLGYLNGKAYINLDKFWTCPDEIASLVRKMGMQDQVLIKTGAGEENFARVEAVASDLPYMVIAREKDDFSDNLLKRNMRYVGVEALFVTEEAPICQPEYLQAMNAKGLVTWVNSIVYNYKAVLSAGHTDDVAVSEDPDYGWGWLLDRGFRIIQTDWPLALKQYIEGRK